jgi:asparaginyl-tRNA synthetase
MAQHTQIRGLLASGEPMERALARGWVRTRRDSKGLSFVELCDGSSLAGLQVILDWDALGKEALADVSTGASIECEGALVESPGKGQRWELRASRVTVLGKCDPSYPLQKKRHTDEFLRGIAHLRPRANKYGAMFRLRSEAAHLIHGYFRDLGFFYVHTPIITGSDAEGAGELFRVSTPAAPGAGESAGQGDAFFGRPASLTVSGQLEAELLAMGLGRVYTFGPTFRAERSNTPRHAAEFWMVEPEAAFFDLEDDMALAEGLVRHVASGVLSSRAEDLGLFSRFVDAGLEGRLERLTGAPYHRVSYDEAVGILKKSGREFEYEPAIGADIQTEHERFLTESHFNGPVFVFDYPKGIKPFYMRLTDDGERVRAMDLLVPKVGELIGGSQREERPGPLLSRIGELGMDPSAYWWYLDTRRYGTVPHSGFGLGFERLLMLLTGVSNIRDVIPFPRTPGSLEF